MTTPDLQSLADRGLCVGVPLPAKTGEARKVIREKLKEMGCDPIEILAKIALGKEIDGRMPELSDMKDAAKELANYIAPKLKAVEHVDTAAMAGGVMLIPVVGSMEEWGKVVAANKMKTIEAEAVK